MSVHNVGHNETYKNINLQLNKTEQQELMSILENAERALNDDAYYPQILTIRYILLKLREVD